MIYLIGGAPRCGKTTLAINLSKKLGISWISADSLESIVAEYTPANKIPALFPKRVLRKKTKLSNDLLYTTYSSKKIRDSYIKQSKVSWLAIETLVADFTREGHDLIIEGHQLHPQLIKKLVKKYPGTKGLTLVRTSKETLISDALKNKAKNDWFVQRTKDPKIYNLIADMLLSYSEFFIKESKKHGIKAVRMDNFKKNLVASTLILQSSR